MPLLSLWTFVACSIVNFNFTLSLPPKFLENLRTPASCGKPSLFVTQYRQQNNLVEFQGEKRGEEFLHKKLSNRREIAIIGPQTPTAHSVP
jgi:hypothetical protein